MGGLAFKDRGSGEPVVNRVGLTPGQSLLSQNVDRDPVFRMHHDRRTVLRCLLHRAEDLTVCRIEHAGIGHEHLERGDSLAESDVHLLERLVGDVADDQMKSVVDGTVSIRLLHPSLEPVHEVLLFRLDGEVDDRGGAAPCGGSGTGLEGIGCLGAAKWELHVSVHIDAPRDHIFPRGVDDLVRAGLPIVTAGRSQCGDLLVVDENIGEHLLGGGDDSAAFDN